MTSSSPRYTAVAIGLHWLIAIGVIALIAMGLTMMHGAIAPATKFKLYQLHKSVGITVLLLMVLRVAWRLGHRPPPQPDAMPQLERRAAAGSHAAFYALLLGLPLSGWALVSVAPLNIPTVLFGVIRWPHLAMLTGLRNKAPVAAVLEAAHAYGGWLLAALILLHSAAALRHHFVAGDDVLRRMLPWRKRAAPTPDLSLPAESQMP